MTIAAGRRSRRVGAIPDDTRPLKTVLEDSHKQVAMVLASTADDREALAKQVELQRRAAEYATRFIALPPDRIDDAIREALAGIGRLSGAERGLLGRLADDGSGWVCTHEWVDDGGPSFVAAIENGPPLSWSLRKLSAGETISYSRFDDVPEGAAGDVALWRALGLRSILLFPARGEDGRLLGFVSFATTSKEMHWPAGLKPFFTIVGDMLRSALETSRRRMELERSELRLRRLMESGIVGILEVDFDGVIREANEIALRVLGYSRADLEAGEVRIDPLTPTEYHAVAQAARETYTEQANPNLWEQDVYRRDGSRRTLLVGTGSAMDRPDRMLVFALDITASKEAERELVLRARLGRLVTLFSTRFIGLPAADLEAAIEDSLRDVGRILDADRASVWLDDESDATRCVLEYRWSRDSASSSGAGYVLEIPKFPCWEEAFRRGDCVIVRDAGAELPEGSPERAYFEARGVVTAAAVPLPVGDSSLGFVTFVAAQPREWSAATVGLLKVIGEILATTFARARNEERRRSIHEELERHVAERTARLEAANRELEAFSHAVSHDLRAPLRGIDGFSGILVEDHARRLPPEAAKILGRIRATSQRMGELIDALLRLSRIARSQPRFETIDLSRIASEVAATLAAGEPSRRVRFSIQSLVRVEGEQRLLEILVDNLLRNAWKFTSTRIDGLIEFGSRVVDGETVCYVRDNGVGFDPDQAERIFLPFQRLHDPSLYEGHGVGLATVKRIVTVHGGRVWAEGAPDEGATVYFTLAPT